MFTNIAYMWKHDDEGEHLAETGLKASPARPLRGGANLKKGGLRTRNLPTFEPPHLDVCSGGNEDHAVSVI